MKSAETLAKAQHGCGKQQLCPEGELREAGPSDVEMFACLDWMAFRTSLSPPAFHSFLKREMSPPPSDLSEGVNTIGPGRQGKYLLVFHFRKYLPPGAIFVEVATPPSLKFRPPFRHYLPRRPKARPPKAIPMALPLS